MKARFGLILACAGCGDFTGATGEFGRLQYVLATDYESDVTDLADAVLLTGYPVQMQVGLGGSVEEEDAEQADQIRHSPSSGRLETETGGEGDPADFALTVDDPGVVTVTSTLEGELFDRIELRFDRPTELELVVWVRSPWAEEWVEAPGDRPLSVEEGGQISFLAIPRGRGGRRLLGEFTPDVQVEPASLVVPDATVLNVYEDTVWTAEAPVSFFAIEPGTTTFTLSDLQNEVSASLELTVLPLGSGS